ncbi:hypothetical protein ABU614_19140 [Lysobacter firmicutimachus]|uniref:Uncharacterized protein n=1 Tax=Lysobacter firmicutimachus TaxID=1792846 RepID=A0AAU8MR07_9GAMM|nr:hypothetical protein [Lysobacter antibioticus]
MSLFNDTAQSVRELWIAPAGSEEWRRIALPLSGLAAGAEQTLRLSAPPGGCVFDLRFDLRRGWNFLHRGVDFCRFDTYRLGRYLRGKSPPRPVALRDERPRVQGVAAQPAD